MGRELDAFVCSRRGRAGAAAAINGHAAPPREHEPLRATNANLEVVAHRAAAQQRVRGAPQPHHPCLPHLWHSRAPRRPQRGSSSDLQSNQIAISLFTASDLFIASDFFTECDQVTAAGTGELACNHIAISLSTS